MVGFINRRIRGLDTILSGLAAGALVHAVAGIVFVALALLKIEGCDIADGRALALAAAVVIDVLLTVCLLWIISRLNDHDRPAAFIGWAVSLAPALALFAIAVAHVNSLPSGCGV